MALGDRQPMTLLTKVLASVIATLLVLVAVGFNSSQIATVATHLDEVSKSLQVHVNSEGHTGSLIRIDALEKLSDSRIKNIEILLQETRTDQKVMMRLLQEHISEKPVK